MQKNIAILGSTGSIGTQALEVIDAHPDLFSVEVLTANNNVDLLIQQAIKYKPNIVAIGNKNLYPVLKDALANEPIKVYSGAEAISQVAATGTVDMVLSSLVGFSGLLPTIRALEAGIPVALANKETLVVAGDIVMELSRKNNAPVVPVDSEHSAIFQCLQGEQHNAIEKITLTASGGPFRGKNVEFLRKVTRCQALNHPNWKMGDKVTIDSASLMNKGLEAIEARWLFDLTPDQIDVVVHPQSIIHSLIHFIDGSVKAQMGLPDMRLPIQYALGYPTRLKSNLPRFDFSAYPELTFEKADIKVFRNLAMAFEVMRLGGNMPCAMNAANEVAVAAFLNGRSGFVEMSSIIEQSIAKCSFIAKPSFDDYVATDREVRAIASSFVRM
ncbi:1-deoxy-D-xylulose-5-phosphate reductoisomerase [Xiashengella succiniciproducens]|jgi:1-deoxy-D-xylulose-5-phosphate reductoisomerase|uniref:1-deoxy-D-xylulose 5-phosphate reductoisomerase n=1 Tax=Xiashengella succiniciproducens TaxID=2949635 RepID=A0A9J6ZPK3_9BACT|nr:1-deoxy-D-xylulose-5-phosphate reductoisomerase [Alkaliflexus sp. Ai-910]MDI9537921.1 1-deoxy-D-xylulose-5-phosphate reductoisomerase [Bacteroidota bacterium]URW79585.1 1-deoxy-D-xylulose-5-phosphate reductoisomerase [Alkaliflexus sp. Ai-910]